MPSVLASASMSSSLNEHQIYQPDSIIDPSKLTLNHTSSSPAENGHLSPYSYHNNYSNSASPSFNTQSTPGELISDNGGNSELSDYDDEFFGVDFGAGEEIPTLSSTLELQSPSDKNYTLATGFSNIQIKHTSSSSIYTHPLSPVDTETPSRQSSTRSDSNDLNIQSTPNHELHMDFGSSPKSYDNTIATSIPISRANLHPTPDRSNSSQGSVESQGHNSMYPHSQSPRVMVSQYGSMEDVGISASALQGPGGVDPLAADISDDEEFVGRTGLGPDARKLLGDTEIPNLSEQGLFDRIKTKNAEIMSWRTRAASVGGDEPSQQHSSYGLGAPSDSSRRRSKSTGAISSQNDRMGIDINETPVLVPGDEQYNPPTDGWDSRPASPRENKLIEGQLYFNPNARTGAGEIDIKLIQEAPRQWSDAPAFPYITESRVQPPTANAAMARFNFDNFSQASRAATWGTRRKSEPSVADMELFTDGGFLKKLTINKGKKNEKPRQGNLFAKFQNKRDRSGNDGSPLKQKSDSSSSLAPPSRTSSFGKKATPSLNTAIAAMAGSAAAVGAAGHARSGSFSKGGPGNPQPSVSPKSPFGFVGTALKRARSKSDLPLLGVDVSSQQPGLADLWKVLNGPPVPTLSSPAIDIDGPMTNDHIEQDEDDEDDEQGGEYENKVDLESPIVATKDGFQAHVRKLNPDMQHQFLIERIAHQQMVRYKNLLNMKVKHLQHVRGGDCPSGKNCLALGGSTTLLDTKNVGRKTGSAPNGFLPDGDSEDDSLPEEGAITPDTFPPGVPMPPTQRLPAMFECQLCFKVKQFQKPSDWTKHVHEDVQPFTCTYANCKESKSFKRKADWVRHENERHRHLEWWTCQFDDCAHKCYRKDNFLQHLVREHKLPEPKQKRKLDIKKAHGTEEIVWRMLRECHDDTKNRPQDEPCKFCSKQLTSWKKLTVHLAKHMEHISLPILRLVEQKVVESDTIISPVEPQQTPRGPFTPNVMTKQESQSSTQFSDTISPNLPTSGFIQYSHYPTPISASNSHPQSLSMHMQMPMDSQNVDYNNASMYPNPYGQPSAIQTQMQSTGFTPLTAHPIGQTYPNQMGNQHYNSYQVTNGPALDPNQAFVGLGVSAAPTMANFQQNSHMMGGPEVSRYGFQQASNSNLDYTQMTPTRVSQGNSPSYPTSQTRSPQPPFPQGHSPQYPYHGR